jgi:hypothetical protein
MVISECVPLEFKWQRAKPARLTPLHTAIPTTTVDSIMRPFLLYSLFLVPFTFVLAQVSSLINYFSGRTTLDDVT